MDPFTNSVDFSSAHYPCARFTYIYIMAEITQISALQFSVLEKMEVVVPVRGIGWRNPLKIHSNNVVWATHEMPKRSPAKKQIGSPGKPCYFSPLLQQYLLFLILRGWGLSTNCEWNKEKYIKSVATHDLINIKTSVANRAKSRSCRIKRGATVALR